MAFPVKIDEYKTTSRKNNNVRVIGECLGAKLKLNIAQCTAFDFQTPPSFHLGFLF
jgi:hypothetical protein